MYTGHVVAVRRCRAMDRNLVAAALLLPLSVLATKRLVIAPEEEYLTHRFGA